MKWDIIWYVRPGERVNNDYYWLQDDTREAVFYKKQKEKKKVLIHKELQLLQRFTLDIKYREEERDITV